MIQIRRDLTDQIFLFLLQPALAAGVLLLDGVNGQEQDAGAEPLTDRTVFVQRGAVQRVEDRHDAADLCGAPVQRDHRAV